MVAKKGAGMSRTPAWLMIATLGLCVSPAAQASLGGNTATVGTDQVRMQAQSHTVTPAGAGARHTLALGNGGEVREYTNAAGTVYAVRWTGPGKPDLESVLGVHFATLQADNPISARRGLRRPPSVNRTDLRVVTGGHAGAFWGYAWLPQNVPAGFDPASL
jgi:hypothetical protein